MDQPRQHAHGIGAAGKAEQVDLIAILVVGHQEGVGREHIVIEPIAGGEPQNGVEILPQPVPRIRPFQRADAGIVKHKLPRLRLLRLAQAAIELQHVRDVFGDLVAGAVAKDDDVSHERLAGNRWYYLGEHSGFWGIFDDATSDHRSFVHGISAARKAPAPHAASVTARIFRCTPVSSCNTPMTPSRFSAAGLPSGPQHAHQAFRRAPPR